MLSIDHLLKRKLELSNYFKSEIIAHPSPGRKENVDDKFIRKVINIIESNISNPALSVEMISDENRRESHTFVPKAKIIDPFFSERNHQKVSDKKSFAVIKNKEGNISEITYEVGFSNLSYFAKCFKLEFGVSPKEYQQKESKHNFDISENFQP